MALKKVQQVSNTALAVFAGIKLSVLINTAVAQPSQFSCQPNQAGDGWICEDVGPIQSSDTADDNNRYNSETAILPREPSASNTANNQRNSLIINSERPARGEETSEDQIGPSNESVDQTKNNFSRINDITESTPLVLSRPVYALDWVPRSELSAEELQTLPNNCCGSYVDPLAQLKTVKNKTGDPETTFVSESGLSQLNQSLISIDGNVRVQQGDRYIINDETTSINRDTDVVLMDGNIIFREPGFLMLGSSAYIDSENATNRIENAQYVLHNYGAHGNANSIVYSSDSGLVSIENGEFSRCEPGNSFWKLRADNIILDQSANRGFAKNVSLRIGDTPIFYFPGTLPFPLGADPISGFLAPSTGSTRSGGFDFELPYYFHLAPNYDATLSPRLISDRGVLAGLETRYLGRWSMNTLNLAGLSGDKLYDPKTAGTPGSNSPLSEDRWFLGFEHFGSLGQNWSTFVDYNAVSDRDYFYDLGSNGLNLTSRTHLNRQGRIDFSSDFLRAGINVQRIDIIDPFFSTSNASKPFDRLPQIQIESGADLWGGLRVAIKTEFSSFNRNLEEALLTNLELQNGVLVHGDRLIVEPELDWSLKKPGWFIRTKGKYRHAEYKLQNQAISSLKDPTLSIGSYSFDSGLIFERNLARSAQGWRSTIEPRIYYLYNEYVDQSKLPLFDTSELNFSFNQLFRNDRFSGGDRFGDADQATFAITTRLLNPKGKETARASIGQIRYFRDRLVTIASPLHDRLSRYSTQTNRSSIVGEVAFTLGSSWRFNSDAQWNEEKKEIDEGVIQLRYQRDDDHLFNVAYRVRNLIPTSMFLIPFNIDSRIKQTDVSAVWPISANWRVLGRINYDHSNSRNLETFAGLEWSNCCATIRLIGREWVDEDELFLPNMEPNNGVFVQVSLNGFGNLTGGGLSSLLSDSIWGFRESNYDF